jgi:hypothetical protein
MVEPETRYYPLNKQIRISWAILVHDVLNNIVPIAGFLEISMNTELRSSEQQKGSAFILYIVGL